MGKLELKLLGPSEVLHDGHPLKFRARKSLALLAYLAAEGGRHSRSELTALLWPESDEAHGRTALRSALSGLRGVLEEAAEPPGKAHLLADRDSLGLTFGPDLALDLHVLEEAHSLTRSGVSVDGDGRCGMLERLRAAAEAYRGDFLEGFSVDGAPDFELWLELEREAWRGRVGGVHALLSKLQLEGGAFGDAAATATRWVRHDPLSEDASRRLIEALLAAGDHSEALHAYESLRSAMKEKLDVEPSPETEALATRVRAEQSGRRAPASSPASLGAPLVGRSAEFGVLISGYHAALSEGARAAAVVGEAGIGKTRLSNEFLRWARTQGADTLEGRAFEAGGRLPYGPVVDALRERLDRERSPDDLLSDVWLSEISRLLPELRERYPDLPAPAPEEAAGRAQLFEGIARLIEALAERKPVVLFIDDLQWADAASLDVLLYTARRWAAAVPLFLILNLRAEALDVNLSLAGWLSSLRRELPVRRVTPGPLTEEDNTLGVVRAMTGDASPGLERLGRRLFEETGGQPLFLTETLKALAEKGVLVPDPGAEGGWAVKDADASLSGDLVAPGVRDVIGGRLSRLGRDASLLLAAGAVLGHGFGFRQLCRVAGLDEDRGLSALDETLDARLMRETQDPENVWSDALYDFTHDKIRDITYTEVGEARRRVFHRRALEALEEEVAPPAELARHAIAAGLPREAFRHDLDAGDAAMEVLALRDAIAHYERAKSLPGAQARGAEEIEHLYVNLSRACQLNGEWDEARTVYEEMLSYARGGHEISLEWSALNRMGILAAQRSFDTDAAIPLIEEALSVAKTSGDDTMLAETEWNFAQMTTLGWKLDRALSHGERASSLARELGLTELEARSLYTLALAYAFAGRYEESVARAAKAVESYAAMGGREGGVRTLSAQFIWAGSPPSSPLANRAMEALSLSSLAFGEVNRGKPQAAIEAARKALGLSRETNNAWARTFSALNLAYGLVEVGEYGEALRACEEVIGEARALSNPSPLYFLLFATGNAYQDAFGLDEARTVYLEALGLGGKSSLRVYGHVIVSRLCANRALAGDWEEAHAYALKSASARDEAPTPLMRMDFARHHETEALLRGGDAERAREDINILGERVGDNRRFRLAYLRASAVIERWDGEEERAIERLREGALLAEEMGLPGESWQIRAEMGDMYRESGRKERADEEYARASETARSLAARLGDGALREGFLASQRVRRVMGRLDPPSVRLQSRGEQENHYPGDGDGGERET